VPSFALLKGRPQGCRGDDEGGDAPTDDQVRADEQCLALEHQAEWIRQCGTTFNLEWITNGESGEIPEK